MIPKAPPSPESLLSALRNMESPAAEDVTLKARVHGRLTVSLLGLSPAVTSTCPPPLGGEVGAPSSHLATAADAALRSHQAIILAWLAPVFVSGVVTGIFGNQWYTRSHRSEVVPPRPVVERVEPRRTLAVAPAVVASAETVPAETPRAVVATTQTHSAQAPTEPTSSLAAERKLLDAARTALARGEPQAALLALGQHTKQFPKGVFTEEREALHVRILAAAGDDVGARARAEAFRQRFPNSMFLP